MNALALLSALMVGSELVAAHAATRSVSDATDEANAGPDSRWPSVVAFCVVIVVLGAPAVPLVVVSAGSAAVVALRRRRIRPRTATPLEVAECADLFAAGLTAGSTLTLIVDGLGHALTGPVGRALRDAERDHRLGRPLLDALDATLGSLGADSQRLVGLLRSTQAGASIGSDLGALSTDLRERHRQQLETESRRLPVVMLAPMMLCILPAFLLLTVVPLVADGVRVLIG